MVQESQKPCKYGSYFTIIKPHQPVNNGRSLTIPSTHILLKLLVTTSTHTLATPAGQSLGQVASAACAQTFDGVPEHHVSWTLNCCKVVYPPGK